ncbi:hypothetical protein J6590_057229 [Homalodisca vitripennis]|nr:hypothetical protein J6590_057229 [Homalodisca vitripennis]
MRPDRRDPSGGTRGARQWRDTGRGAVGARQRRITWRVISVPIFFVRMVNFLITKYIAIHGTFIVTETITFIIHFIVKNAINFAITQTS